jgi:predicted transcriptional regulator
MKSTTKAAKASRAKHGVTSTSFFLSEEEKAKIDDLAEDLGVSRKEAVMLAVRAYRSKEMSRDELLAEIRRRLK